MIVQCPKCQARYRIEEKQLAGRMRVQVKCTKCQTVFPVNLAEANPAATPSAAGGSAPEATLVSRKSQSLHLPEGKTVALSVTSGPAKGQVFSITKPRVTIGRGNADLVLDDPEVSRQHCALELRGSTALLVDLGSTNGTFVNDQKIETSELEHLSEFHIGSSTLMLTITAKS